MRKLLLTLAAACSIAFVSHAGPAEAMTPARIDRAAAGTATEPQPVVYICKQRYWSGKRYCYWRPGGYHWRWHWRWPRWRR